MLKREWSSESNRKLSHLIIPSKTATLVPEFAEEDLPLGRTVALMPEFAVTSKREVLSVLEFGTYVKYCLYIAPLLASLPNMIPGLLQR